MPPFKPIKPAMKFFQFSFFFQDNDNDKANDKVIKKIFFRHGIKLTAYRMFPCWKFLEILPWKFNFGSSSHNLCAYGALLFLYYQGSALCNWWLFYIGRNKSHKSKNSKTAKTAGFPYFLLISCLRLFYNSQLLEIKSQFFLLTSLVWQYVFIFLFLTVEQGIETGLNCL